MQLPGPSDLAFLFVGLGSSILMLWTAWLFRTQRSAGARCMLISALIELPTSQVRDVYWFIWPNGMFADISDPFGGYDPESLAYRVSGFCGHAAMLFMMLWFVGLLLVALRYRQEIERTRELQEVLEPRIREDSSKTPP